MRRIVFKQDIAQRIYDDYIKRLNRAADPLSKMDKEEILKEFNSHIYEGIKRNKEQKEEAKALLDILDQLGSPEISLKPIVANKKLTQATKTFNPVHVFQALILNIANGFAYIIFMILYISLFGGIVLIYLEISDPESVGLYFLNGNFLAIGEFIKGVDQLEAEEVLGSWFIPVIFIAMILVYSVLTFFLGFKRKINRNLDSK